MNGVHEVTEYLPGISKCLQSLKSDDKNLQVEYCNELCYLERAYLGAIEIEVIKEDYVI